MKSGDFCRNPAEIRSDSAKTACFPGIPAAIPQIPAESRNTPRALPATSSATRAAGRGVLCALPRERGVAHRVPWSGLRLANGCISPGAFPEGRSGDCAHQRLARRRRTSTSQVRGRPRAIPSCLRAAGRPRKARRYPQSPAPPDRTPTAIPKPARPLPPPCVSWSPLAASATRGVDRDQRPHPGEPQPEVPPAGSLVSTPCRCAGTVPSRPLGRVRPLRVGHSPIVPQGGSFLRHWQRPNRSSARRGESATVQGSSGQRGTGTVTAGAQPPTGHASGSPPFAASECHRQLRLSRGIVVRNRSAHRGVPYGSRCVSAAVKAVARRDRSLELRGPAVP